MAHNNNVVCKIIKTWKVYGTTVTLSREGHPLKLNDWVRWAIVKKATKKPRVTWR